MTENKNAAGTIEIAPDVIASIASIAVADVPGIAGFSSKIVDNITKIGRKNLTKGIKVEMNEDSMVIDIYAIVEYGSAINKVSADAQKAVKAAVEAATGLTCSQVNMHIQGILSPPESDSLDEG